MFFGVVRQHENDAAAKNKRFHFSGSLAMIDLRKIALAQVELGG